MTIKTKVTFKKRLEPFGDLLQEMYEKTNELLQSMTDDELRQIIEDAKRPTETNCWWAIYHMREIVAYEAKIILQIRGKEAEA